MQTRTSEIKKVIDNDIYENLFIMKDRPYYLLKILSPISEIHNSLMIAFLKRLETYEEVKILLENISKLIDNEPEESSLIIPQDVMMKLNSLLHYCEQGLLEEAD